MNISSGQNIDFRSSISYESKSNKIDYKIQIKKTTSKLNIKIWRRNKKHGTMVGASFIRENPMTKTIWRKKSGYYEHTLQKRCN